MEAPTARPAVCVGIDVSTLRATSPRHSEFYALIIAICQPRPAGARLAVRANRWTVRQFTDKFASRDVGAESRNIQGGGGAWTSSVQ